MTKWRGQLLFEMQAATVVLAQKALDEGKVQRFQAQVPNFCTIVKYIYKILDIFTYTSPPPQLILFF